jgi:hypothetical protein
MESRRHPWGRKWWLLAWLLLTAGVYGGYRLTRPVWADSEASQKYQAIQLGMAEEEVAALLGYDTSHLREHAGDGSPVMVSGFARLVWQSGDDKVVAYVQRDISQVVRKGAVIRGHEFSDPPDPNRSLWDGWRARLGW